MRIGTGYDIHVLTKSRPLILGGVEIPNEPGLLGHSDADVLLHAIIDALFGALGKGDIGEYFSDSDPKYKDIESLKLLRQTGEILKSEGYKIINIDTNVICEKPKLLPYKAEMKKNIAGALGISQELISIKAKTKEGMDSTGERKSIEAFCVVLIENE